MTRARVPASLRRRVLAESGGRCAYCHSLTAITGARFAIDHIIAEARGGPSIWENLCLCCHLCNEFKGARQDAQVPLTGELVPLFHPRRQRWREHFCWSEYGTTIVGFTSVGRATIAALQMNHPVIVAARRHWVGVGWQSPVDDAPEES